MGYALRADFDCSGPAEGHNTITKLVEAKIHAAFFHSGLAGSSYDPDQVVDYQERLLAAVIDELHKDKP